MVKIANCLDYMEKTGWHFAGCRLENNPVKRRGYRSYFFKSECGNTVCVMSIRALRARYKNNNP